MKIQKVQISVIRLFFPWDALEAEIVAWVNLVASWDLNFSGNYHLLAVFLTPHFVPSQWYQSELGLPEATSWVTDLIGCLQGAYLT